MRDDNSSSPIGLLRCMSMLADEAHSLELTNTLAALQKAMETCRVEAVLKSQSHSAAVH